MANEEEIEIDVTERFPAVTLVLDVGLHPEAPSRITRVPKAVAFTKGQDIKFRVALKKLDESTVPPSLVPLDITGMAARWTLRDKEPQVPAETPPSALVFSVVGVILGLPTDGIFEFTVAGSVFNALLEKAPSQFKLYTDGITTNPPDIVEDIHVTARQVLADVP